MGIIMLEKTRTRARLSGDKKLEAIMTEEIRKLIQVYNDRKNRDTPPDMV